MRLCDEQNTGELWEEEEETRCCAQTETPQRRTEPTQETSHPPDCLIVQPAGGAAGEAVIERRPQLGRRGHLSRRFLARVLSVAERQGVASCQSLVVEQHTCSS